MSSKYDLPEQFIEQEKTTRRTYVAPAPLNRAALLAAIPIEYRGLIYRHEAAGAVDPIDAAARDLEWKWMIADARELVKPSGKGERYYPSLLGNLQKARGSAPVSSVTEKAVLGESAGSGSSIILSPVLEGDVIRMISDNAVVRKLATVLSARAITLQVPVENSNVAAYLVPETTVITDSMPVTTFAQRALTTKLFAGFATVSNQLLDDEVIGLNNYLLSAITEQFGVIEDRGSLDSTNFSGIATAPGVNSMSTNNSIASGGGQPTWAELQQLIFLPLQAHSRAGARLFMHPRALLTLTNATATNGQPIVTYTAGADGQIQASALGFPISCVASLSTGQATYTSSSNVYFGNPTLLLYADVSGVGLTIDPFTLLHAVQTRISVVRRTGILCPVGSAFSFMRGVRA